MLYIVHGQAPSNPRAGIKLGSYLRELYELMAKAHFSEDERQTAIIRLLSGTALERWQAYRSRSNVETVGDAILAMEETEESFSQAFGAAFVPGRRLPGTEVTGVAALALPSARFSSFLQLVQCLWWDLFVTSCDPYCRAMLPVAPSFAPSPSSVVCCSSHFW